MMAEFNYRRVPRWILIVGAAGTVIAGILRGITGASGFAIGAAASWWNYTMLVRVVERLGQAAVQQKNPRAGKTTVFLFIQLLVLGAIVLVILRYSRINLIALLVGLFASCIAIGAEIAYELLWSTNTKSG